MEIIGIVGKQGSGKSRLALMLSKRLNCQYIDIDKISHKALLQSDIIESIGKKFGDKVIDSKGNVIRKELGKIVFTQSEKMKELYDITRGYIENSLDEILSNNEEFIVLDYALLPESKHWDNCTLKILVKANDVIRKQRVMKRDKIPEEYFEKRDANCLDYTSFYFDYIFENDYCHETMNEMLDIICSKYTKP